jgi:hypothetical protein
MLGMQADGLCRVCGTDVICWGLMSSVSQVSSHLVSDRSDANDINGTARLLIMSAG